MQIELVKSKEDIKQFLNVVNLIYKDTAAYIRPLDKDVEFVFNQEKNKYFRHGECVRWLLKDGNKCIGRIAAFVNEKYTSQFNHVGGIGFFECVDNKEAAFKLLDTAKKWLQEKGMKYADGPINFQEKDKFWGLTLDNFDKSPYYGQNYNPEYYVTFFKEYGFQLFYEQIIYYRKVYTPVPEKFRKKAERLNADPRFVVKTIKKNNLPKFTEDFRSIYNAAWGKREGDKFKGMNEAQAKSIMKALKPVMDEELMYFAYYEDKPIGFYIALPEVNQIFKKFNGKLGLIQKLRFLWNLKVKGIKTSFGLAFGVDPELQGKGVEGALFMACSNTLVRGNTIKYDDVIITWIGDFNPKMIAIIEQLGAEVHQTMATMRLPFDENEVIERYQITDKH